MTFRAQYLLVVILVWIGGQIADGGLVQHDYRKCEPITIPLCQSMNYNLTRMPNYFRHTNQENVLQELKKNSYADHLCSTQLVFFLCTLHLPICIKDMGFVPPCRSVCEKVKRECIGVVKKFGMEWPETLDCDSFPVYEVGFCVKPEAFVLGEGETDEESTEIIDSKPDRSSCPMCVNKVRPTFHNFAKNYYKYAIIAEVISVTTTASGETITRVFVSKVLITSDVTIGTGPIKLWTNSTCVCPVLQIDKKYIIIGNQDIDADKLMLERNSMVEVIEDSDISAWEEKLEKWNRKMMKNQEEKQSKKKYKNGQRKHRRFRPTLRNHSRRLHWIWLL